MRWFMRALSGVGRAIMILLATVFVGLLVPKLFSVASDAWAGMKGGNTSPLSSEPLKAAEAKRLEPARFTAELAERFRKADPRSKVEITAPLHLEITASGGVFETGLERLRSACVADAAECDGMIDEMVSVLATRHARSDVQFTRESVRLAVRTQDVLEAVRRSSGGAGKAVAAPVAGELWAFAVADSPTALIYLNDQAIGPLNMQPDQVLALARDNMRKPLSSIMAKVTKIVTNSHGRISMIVDQTGGGYQASLVALPELWAPLAGKMGGTLLVAVPDRDILLVGDGGRHASVAKMVQAARSGMLSGSSSLTDEVLRWTPTGWVVASPPSDQP